MWFLTLTVFACNYEDSQQKGILLCVIFLYWWNQFNESFQAKFQYFITATLEMNEHFHSVQTPEYQEMYNP